MTWDTYNSNNESTLLKANGPYRLMTSDNSFRGTRRPFMADIYIPIVISKIKIVTSIAVTDSATDQADDKQTLRQDDIQA